MCLYLLKPYLFCLGSISKNIASNKTKEVTLTLFRMEGQIDTLPVFSM